MSFPDDEMLARLREVFAASLSDPTGPTSENPPEYVFNTTAPHSVGPPAQVYAGGGAVDTIGGPNEEDYGAGRFTRTPEERRTVRERAISQHQMPSPEDDFLAREWQRYTDRHNYNPLSYGLEALGRLDNRAGAAREGEHGISARDVWDFVSPDPQFRREYGYPGAVADALSIASFPASGPVGKAMSWATPLLYGVGEAAMGAMGFDEGGVVADDGAEYAGGGKVSRAIKLIGDKFGSFQAERMQRAADETNLDRFSAKGLEDTFNPRNSGLYVSMPPGDFQDYAMPLPKSSRDAVPYPRFPNIPPRKRSGFSRDDETLDNYLALMAPHLERRGMDDAPSLWLYRNLDDLTAVEGHEGRHREMALDRMGDPRSLVRLQPVNSGELGPALGKFDPEDVVDRLMRKYTPRGANQLIVPESLSPELRRMPKPLYSEPYAGGGKVLSLIERLAGGKPKEVKLPGGATMPAYPIKEFEDVAEKFAGRYGNEYPIENFPKLDEDRARKIAEAYELMQHAPNDPRVKRAYNALIDETMDQYRALEGTGARFEFLKPGEADPYALSPSLGYQDLVENGRLKVFPTEQGYGTQTDILDNPLLRRVGRVGDLDNATANDAFRVVHDALGHFGPGNPFFRAPGEERAWLAHSRAYSPDALPAATSETRGQNSWVNFGPRAVENKGASGADTIYADQKAGLLPEWMYEPDGKPGYAGGGAVQYFKTGKLVKKAAEVARGLFKKDEFVEPSKTEELLSRWEARNTDAPQRDPGDPRLSTRVPTATKSFEDPIDRNLAIGVNELIGTPGVAEHNTGLIARYPGFGHPQLVDMSPSEKAQHYVDRSAENLHWLMRNAPEPIKERGPSWYPGVRRILDSWSERYDMPPEALAGVTSALSPQKDWYQNASLAERTLDTLRDQAKTPMTHEMMTTRRNIAALNTPKVDPIFDRIKGARLSDLEDPIDKALWIRLYDEAHNPRQYRTINPEGTYGDFVTNADGQLAKPAWGSLNEIAKAVGSAESGGDLETISRLMGERHKVRNFYNNSLLPWDDRFGDITGDTHAVAANQLRPLSGNSEAVAHNFGNSLAKKHQPPGFEAAKSSSITGVSGSYGLNSDPYRVVAEDLGMLPRAIQSPTWEAVRSLYPDTFKTKRNADTIDAIWAAADRGEISRDQARAFILEKTGGFREPDWARPGALQLDPRSTSTYKIPGSGTPLVSYTGPLDNPNFDIKDFASGGQVDDLDLYHVAMNMKSGGHVLPYKEGGEVDDDFLGYMSMFYGV